MPRGRARGSVIQRGKVWYIKYSIAGRQRWERSGESATAAKKLLARRLTEADQGMTPLERPITFAQFVERWRNDYLGSAQLKPSTLSAYRSVLDRHLIPYFGQLRIDRITTALVQRFIAAKVDETSKRGSPLTPKTIQNCARVLTKIFNTAVDWQMLVRSPFVRVVLPRVERREMDFLRPDEVRRLLDSAPSDASRCLFLVAVSTGMRQGELLALQWEDIDWGRSVIRVRRTLSLGKLQSPKTPRSRREVRIGKMLVRALREQQLRTGGRSEFVFSTSLGSHLDPANLVKRAFEPALRSAGLRRVRFHDLRHTAASIMINDGMNLKFVSHQLGHSSIQITLDRYAHLIPERHDEALDRFEALLFSTVPAEDAADPNPA